MADQVDQVGAAGGQGLRGVNAQFVTGQGDPDDGKVWIGFEDLGSQASDVFSWRLFFGDDQDVGSILGQARQHAVIESPGAEQIYILSTVQNVLQALAEQVLLTQEDDAPLFHSTSTAH